MAAYIFQDLAKKATNANIPLQTQESLKWFRGMAQNISVSPQRLLSTDENELVQRVDASMIGSMLFYFYNPKGKDTLPYYDRFPLIFVTDVHPDGWSGINLHYLPPVLRAQIMETLYQTATNKKQPEKMRLKLSYNILKNLSSAPLIKQCYKRYLKTQIASNLMRVKPTNWDMAAFLPTQRFVKKSAEQVWVDTRKKAKQRGVRR